MGINRETIIFSLIIGFSSSAIMEPYEVFNRLQYLPSLLPIDLRFPILRVTGSFLRWTVVVIGRLRVDDNYGDCIIPFYSEISGIRARI